jgi:hypothetical protein
MTSPTSSNGAPRHARDLTEAEFVAALRTHAWRDAKASSAAPATPAKSAATSGTSNGTTTAPAPHVPPASKPALAMSNAEFAAAMRNRAWRK